MAERPPQRTCVGCRVRAAKQDLLRVVAVGGVLVPDPRGRMPGRGAYLHPALVCLDLAERRRAFVRALRAGGPLVSAGLRARLPEYVSTGESEDAVPRSEGPSVQDTVTQDTVTRDGSMN